MPINTDLNIAPYFDDFDVEKQFYKILFKPAYAVQARELTQLQTILQSQIEQFGDNIYQEGSIIKGCNFTDLNGLQYVKLVDKTGFDVTSYVSGPSTDTILGVETDIDVVYELVGTQSGLVASIIAATRGFETRPPDLNTFYINYLTTNEAAGNKAFLPGENLTITRKKYNGSTLYSTEPNIANINVTLQSNPTGKSFGIQASQGIIFQKGHFLFAADQILIVDKYSDQPDDVSVGYEVSESLVTALQDNSLYDNANGSANENAPGADRLKMIPTLVAKSTAVADVDPAFFTLIRYQNGSAVQLRDVSQFNSIAEELAKRTYEESGNYLVDKFGVTVDRRNGDLTALVSKGTAYVKGFRVENSGKIDLTIDQVAATEIVQNVGTAVDYGSYVTITAADINGDVGDLQYTSAVLQTAGGSPIGSAIVKNITPTKLYLFGIEMANNTVSFADVELIVAGSGTISIAANSVLKEKTKAPMIFPTGTKYLKETTDMIVPTRVMENVSVTGSGSGPYTIVLNAGPNEDFVTNQDDIVFVDVSSTYFAVSNVSISGGGTIMTVTLDTPLAPGIAPDPAGVIYYNKRLLTAEPHNKLAVAPYIKVNYQTAKSLYSLGFPDVYAIEDIYDGATGVRYTDSFKLNTNQNDHYYDISYMEYIPGRPAPANNTLLTIKLNAFQINTSTGEYFFSINSYPIDDTTDPLPAGKIRSSDLYTYRGTNGNLYNLRESFDFRPYIDKDGSVDYTDTSASSAGTVSTDVGAYPLSFSGGAYSIPPTQSGITSDQEHYLARVDLITIDSYGKLAIVKGEEATYPVAAKISADEFIVSEIFIPGFPALTQAEAAAQGKFNYAVRVTPRGTKNYTMRDIEKLERRVESMEYYVSLNQLEQETENMLILDENGLSRFKNGYVVDPFNDTRFADLDNPNYSAAIHFDKSILTPAVTTFPLELKYKSSSNATIFPSVNDAEIASLSRNAHVKLMGQPYATNYRNCVSNFYKYDGLAFLSPDHDMLPDATVNPVPVELDLFSLFNDLNSQIPITGVNWSGVVEDGAVTTTRRGGFFGLFGRRTTTIEQIERGETTALQVNDGGTNAVGDFVSNVAFNPYMRTRDVNVYISGLRPDTRHYFFFDSVNVDAHVTPGTTVSQARNIQKYGNAGDAVTTDSNGVLRAVFTIPAETFFVGDRVLTVADVQQFSSIESASTSKADITYHAYNISVEKQTISTRLPEFETVVTGTTTRNLPARVITRHDPLAQTFFIKKGMGRGSNTVFASKVDLYFKRKSAENGVTITLREVQNGYPTGIIIPFSKVHLEPSEVNVSDDATAVTEVLFEAPVRLDIEKEYAVVIMPDANDPNYLHFTSKVGGLDLTAGSTQGQAVVQDWGDGVLFTSTNNRAWKSYQDEDIKFNLYRHDFNAAVGSVTLTNEDHEFFTLSDWNGRFQSEEIVYKETGVSGTVSMIQGTSSITQLAGDFTADYAAGDYIHLSNGTNSDIFQIISVDNALEMTTNKPNPFDFTTGTLTGTSIVAGVVSYYNKFNRSVMHLKRSSATATKKFSAGDTIYGFTSGKEATIGSVDNINLSYIQPMIQKSNDSVTNTAMTGYFNDPSNPVNNYTMPMKFGDNNTFNAKGVLLYSKSNNLVSPKPFDITVNMTNASNPTSTPIVDIELATLMAYQFRTTNSADTTSKYISKVVELASDLDAEDMQVTVTGYRPSGTDIKVYIRPQHAHDSAAFNTIPWMELELFEGINSYCSSSNLNDYREFKYRVAEANKNGGIIEYTSSAGTFTSYRKFAIRIDLLADNIHNVPTLKDYRGVALT